MYFNVVTNHLNNNETVTVEGGGVNATIIQADLVATNGYVHIIDRVLGSPFTTMLQKLKTDPMLKYGNYSDKFGWSLILFLASPAPLIRWD